MIDLKKYNWTKGGNVFTAGFAWSGETFFTGQDFVALIQNNCTDFEQFKKLAGELNGQFSIVVEKENEIWAICSISWTYPLFYINSNSRLAISDRPESLFGKEEQPEIDEFAASYFLQFGVTPFERTLNKSINQVLPGELVVLQKNEDKAKSHFLAEKAKNSTETKTTLEIANHLTLVFESYYEHIKERQVLLPLTRGYDSRLLACLLAELGHKKVLCATWGRANNSEKSTAQKVAKQLGLRYQFIEYNEALINGFQEDPTFIDYVQFSAHLSSMPYLQDYFAIKHLIENKLVDQDTVAFPGHPGDFLRGSHFKDSLMNLQPSELGKTVSEAFGTSYPSIKQFRSELQEYLNQRFFEEQNLSPAKAYDFWDLQERQSKFISNSNQVYTFFGVDVLMPLFDRKSLQFFSSIDARNKNRERLYNKALEDHFFKKHKVDFELKQISDQESPKLQALKNRLIKVAPHQLKTVYYPMNDSIFYREITNQLRQNIKMKHPVKPHSFNAYIVQWYLNFLASQTK
ncbi:asparagine synthase C-terminal domain-containing protein [Draconibacterium sp. IB214405]|uniref:asparagine synthase C-terminal domain-containing protein n=1 Tax=Draconibacterium sp. IB214405 TaxID=3097352 RepID=UPI002A17A413|nr:asparagine synthase C-terminal domain-containing protein [Draconibacterium sp. IB214405]MDX8341470.1 asparagine synthase C-terminal domain-containing protein [Draconibacterium sp. IB214405]